MASDGVALYTTAFPAARPYLAAWHASVLAQDDQDFDLWIGLHGLSADEVSSELGGHPGARWVEPSNGDTPASVRSTALQQIGDRYAMVVCVDSDDVLLPSRVGAARRALEDADVAACALDLVNQQGRPMDIVLGPPDSTAPADYLPRANVFGLSNTAYRTDVLRRCLPLPTDAVLVDWLLAIRAWALGARFSFDRTPQMQYRQHAANLAGMMPPFSGGQVMRASRLVLGHLEHLLDDAWPLPEPVRRAIGQRYARVSRFELAMRHDPILLDRYVTALNALPPIRMWWWHVAHAELEELWTS